MSTEGSGSKSHSPSHTPSISGHSSPGHGSSGHGSPGHKEQLAVRQQQPLEDLGRYSDPLPHSKQEMKEKKKV